MGLSKTIWTNPSDFIRTNRPETPVLFFSPAVLQATARRFIDGFPGLVTYAVKSNPEEAVVENLAAAGVRGYDVASPFEIRPDPPPLPRCGDALQQPGALALGDRRRGRRGR